MRRAPMILVLAAFGAMLAAGCAGGDGEGDAGAGGGRGGYGVGAEPTSSRGSGGGGRRDGDDEDVRIESFRFAPLTIAAKAGQRVTWEHRDAGVTHTVTADGGTFRSGELHEGDEFSHLFPAAGSFPYRCAIHADMRGTVKVSG